MQQGRRAHLTAWQQNKTRLELLRSVVAQLREAGIPSLMLKGAALSLAFYRDPGLRPMRDVDLLVPKERSADAARKLVELGFKPEGGKFPNRLRVGHGWQDYHWDCSGTVS